MDLAYIDKLDKAKNGVKNPLFRQDLFDRTVEAKENENKRFQRNGLCIFDYDYRKQSSQKNWVDKRTVFAGEFTNDAKLMEYKFTVQWVRPSLHLLNVQHDRWKKNFTVTWKTMDTSTFTNWLNLLRQ